MKKANKLINLLSEVTGDEPSVTDPDSADDHVTLPANDTADKLLGDLANDLGEITKGEIEPVPDEFEAKFKAVDKDAIDDEHNQDFTDGGNHPAYPEFVPKGQYWFDKSLSDEGRVAVPSHEFIEDMVLNHITGIGNYDFVHTVVANPVEAIVRWIYRKVNPKKDEMFLPASPEVERWIEMWDKVNEMYIKDRWGK